MSAPTPEFTPRCSKCEYELTGVPDGPCPECGTPFKLEVLRQWFDLMRGAKFRGFQPTCPACKYNLEGIPEGVCPECGRAFTVAELRTLFLEKAKGRVTITAAGAVWFLAWVVCAFVLMAMCGDRRGGGSVLFLWIVCGFVWMLQGHIARKAYVSLPILFLVGALGAGLISSNAGSFYVPRHGSGIPAVLIFCLIGLTVAWALVRHRSANALRCALAGCVMGFALVVFQMSLTGYLRGEHWSNWDDPRSGDPYSQYPLTNREAIALALWVLGPALAVVMWGPLRLLLRRRKVPHAAEPIESVDH